jgi:hypothetical protein
MTIDDPTTFMIHVIYDIGMFEERDSPLSDYIIPMPMAHDGFKRVQRGGYDIIYDAYDYADKLDGDWIYFVEDDYLHAPDAARVFVEGASRFDLITLYDHPDRYTRYDDITAGRESIELTPSCHWRTAASTTCTYAISRTKWQYAREIIKRHGPSESFFKEIIQHLDLRLWTPIPARSTHCYKGYMSPLVDWDKVAEGVKT